jgi:subtilisin family serine protease
MQFKARNGVRRQASCQAVPVFGLKFPRPALLLLMLAAPLLVSCGQGQSRGETFESRPSALSAPAAAGGKTALPTPPTVAPPPAGKETVWVLMRQQASLAQAASAKDWKSRGAAVYQALTSTAQSSQAALSADLTARAVAYEKFWIVNAVKVTATKAILDEIAVRSDVARVVPDRSYRIPPIKRHGAGPKASVLGTEWGLDRIRAPQVWQEIGAFGDGVVVGSIDTGVEYTHPALVQQYRGSLGDGAFDHNYNWYDPASACGLPSGTPCDNASHGTHTMGTMVGDDHAGNQIGVAPHARWIAAKGCESFNCSLTSLVAAGQWMLAPTDLNGQNPRTDLRPHVINNSWGGPGGDDFYRSIVESWVAAGIFPAFAAGNWQSGGIAPCGSVSSPGDYAASFAVGAFDSNGNLADFSLRGPSVGGLIKPNVAAPGVFVRSSVPGGGYDIFDGTSMATPHLAGTVALMWSAADTLARDVDATRALLSTTAVDALEATCGGTPEFNNGWGEGRLDAFAAVDQAPRGPTGTLAGTVLADDGAVVSGATIRATNPQFTRSTVSDASGAFSVRLPVGTYDLTVSAFRYLSQTLTGVVIAQDTTTQVSPILRVAPAFSVSGVITDGDGQPLAGARVSIEATGIAPATTDAAGNYAFAQVPAGDYTLRVEAGGCFDARTAALTVDANETLNLALPARTDSFGYSCRPTAFAFVEATNPLPLVGDDVMVNVSLPFPFAFYGNTYEQAYIASNGFVTFQNTFPSFSNLPIPDPSEPNAAIFALWDDLFVGPDSSVLTETVGTAPDRRFVIEWKNVEFLGQGITVTFEVVLFENGKVELQYQMAGPDPRQRGGSATVGLENASGTVGLQYSFDQPKLDSGMAVAFRAPPYGIVRGTVTDANDGQALPGVEVQASSVNAPVRSTLTDAAGAYRLAVPVGPATIAVSAARYEAASATVQVEDGSLLTQNFVLKSGRASVTPPTLQLLLPVGQTRKRLLYLSNTGSANLSFTVNESGGGRQAMVATRTLKTNPSAKTGAANTRELFAGGVQGHGMTAMEAGDVLFTFTPSITQAWGVGYTGRLWLSEFSNRRNHEFTTQGVATGRVWPALGTGLAAGDMAYDASRNIVCQVEIDGDNGIHCWDPDSGAELASIVGSFPWTTTSQRGLAYRPDDDSFYIGGWNSRVIYHVAGLADPGKGRVLGSCQPVDGVISGLAWNGTAGVLWVATNSPEDTIYQLNPDDCTVLSTLRHPLPGFNGAGLEMDDDGNLWMISQATNQVFLMDSGVPAVSDVPWLSVAPTSGEIAPGGQANLDVTIDTTGLAAGQYLAKLLLKTTAGRAPNLSVPVSLVVTDYQRAINAGGAAYTDSQGEPWVADRAYVTGGWGYYQKGSTASTNRAITGTSDPALYRNQRIDPYAYRFDSVPNGIYQVDLRLAEITNLKKKRRVFDVVIEDTLVLPAHDIDYEVGRFAADDNVFFVEVLDETLDVRFIERAGFEKPAVNAIRVTRRADR